MGKHDVSTRFNERFDTMLFLIESNKHFSSGTWEGIKFRKTNTMTSLKNAGSGSQDVCVDRTTLAGIPSCGKLPKFAQFLLRLSEPRQGRAEIHRTNL